MILDASAVLAFLLAEPGRDIVLRAMVEGADITSVDMAEVLTRYVLRGAREEADNLRRQLPVTIVPVDEDFAYRAAMMAQATRRAGLSLGDRICLALVQRTHEPVLTADRSWRDVAEAVHAQVVLIR